MAVAITSKLFFAVTFPPRTHMSLERLSLLARKQLRDIEIIETIEHLFKCQRCFENYRRIRTHVAVPDGSVLSGIVNASRISSRAAAD